MVLKGSAKMVGVQPVWANIQGQFLIPVQLVTAALCRYYMLTGLDFIRAEGFVFSHVADEGLLNACAGDLLRYRKQIGAEHVQIFTDIKKKHR